MDNNHFDKKPLIGLIALFIIIFVTYLIATPTWREGLLALVKMNRSTKSVPAPTPAPVSLPPTENLCANNQAPTAVISWLGDEFSLDSGITFDGSNSFDPNNNITEYSWSFGDGRTSSGAVVQHSYSAPGSKTVSLTVEDSCGASNTANQTIEIGGVASDQDETLSRLFPGVRLWGPSVGDTNNDGRQEIFAFDASGILYGIDANGVDLPGFPVNLLSLTGPLQPVPISINNSLNNSSRNYPVTVADFDGDGVDDIAAFAFSRDASGGQYLHLFLLNHNGQVKEGWPSQGVTLETSRAVLPAIVAADLDDDGKTGGDGKKELLAKVFSVQNGSQISSLHAFRLNGSQYSATFPMVKTGGGDVLGIMANDSSAPVVADLDGNGDLEIVINFGEVISENSQYKTSVHAINYQDGADLPGWPLRYRDQVMASLTPAVGDLDGEEGLEVVLIGNTDYPGGSEGSKATSVMAYHHTAQPVAGWPVILPVADSAYCSGDNWVHTPTITDLDSDGRKETMVTCANWNASYGFVFALRPNGSVKSGWPKSFPHLHSYEPWRLIVANLSDDYPGKEVLYAAEGDEGSGGEGDDLFAWTSNGTPLQIVPSGLHPEWPRQGTKSLPATLGDLKGDGKADLIYIKSFGSVGLAGAGGSELHVFDLDGSVPTQ